MSTTFETAALWSATPLATDPKKIGAAGLSVRQRKLLTLLSQPMSVAELASSIALPVEEVHSALDRFAKLGLAQSGEPGPVPFDPMRLRATPAVRAAAGTLPSRMPMMIGIAVAALALVAAAAWTLRGSSGASSAPTPGASNATSAASKAPTPTGSADSADTVVPRSTAAPSPATAAPALPAPAATVAPATAAAAANSKAAASAAAPAPLPATKATNTATPAVVAAPAPSAAPALASNQAAAPASASPLTPAPATAAPTVTAAPVATVAPAAASPAPATTVSAPTVVAANTPAPVTPTPARAAPVASREIKLLTRVEPQFPRGFDANSGTVRARLQVDARGAVTGVDIVEANPPRVFDRSVRSALQQWRYEPTGEAFSTMAEISFSR